VSAVDAELTSTASEPPDDGLRAWGWDEGWAASFEEHAASGHLPARVLTEQRGRYLVATPDGERWAAVSGRLRHAASSLADFPAVGDWLALAPAAPPRERGDAPIASLLPRRSRISRRASVELIDERVLAANVDLLLIVQALTHDLNPRRLERYLAMAWSSGASPAVVLNKADLCADLPAALARLAPVTAGVPLHVVSATEGRGLVELRAALAPGATAAFVGSSGVGKSTIVNALLGVARQAVQAVRADDERGRHTTVSRELLATPHGALLLDTPGLRSLELWDAGEGLERTFADIQRLAATCRFSDCSHDHEPGCAVMAAVARGELPAERLAAQRKLEREQRALALRGTPQGRAASRRLGRLYRDAARDVERIKGDAFEQRRAARSS
jgi:ribosome biogenesis GTPase